MLGTSQNKLPLRVAIVPFKTHRTASVPPQTQWNSNSNPLDFKVESIGFQTQTHWVANLNPLGLAEKRGELGKGGELGMMRDVSQRALRLMNGRVLSARPPAKQVIPHHKHTRPVASHVTLFGLQQCHLFTNARSCLAFGCADIFVDPSCEATKSSWYDPFFLQVNRLRSML